ncbi:hypothetical protein ALC60_05463 [Trachymyrmex zeteki]|uniref:Uncharacterized protein n=1 Tax=Mycetomoellerius zeteki TaxID=64791 RepID=A0A151X5P6_9HYME|nr:hypothetical protein ALC60_05463 [Trachymyrmex zeteki]
MAERKSDLGARFVTTGPEIYVLVKLPSPAGPPGTTEGRRKGGGGGGGETTRSCTHGGEHHLTEASDECRAAPLASVYLCTCTHAAFFFPRLCVNAVFFSLCTRRQVYDS